MDLLQFLLVQQDITLNIVTRLKHIHVLMLMKEIQRCIAIVLRYNKKTDNNKCYTAVVLTAQGKQTWNKNEMGKTI